MNAIDLIVLLPLGLAFIRGYRKGFVIEIFTLIGLVVAVIASMKCTSIVMGWIQPIAGNGKWLPFFAYMLTFIGAFLIVLWFGKIIEGLLKAASLGTVNKLFGAALSVLKACFIISLIFWLLTEVNVLPEEARKGSISYRALGDLAPKVIEKSTSWVPWLRDEMKDIKSHFGEDQEEGRSA
jgi:membrane protein required for colicin V production